MRKKLLLIIFMIAIYRVLSFIPIPLAEPTQLRQLIDNVFDSQQLLGFVDLLSGGALSNFSIVLMGLGPYINASIIMQLLTKAVPKLEEINKDGEAGRRKINQYTRIIALPLSLIQAIGFILIIRQQASATVGIDIAATASIFDWVLMVAALTGGSMLLMWIGELMTEQGVGNGISLIIFAGIISQLPTSANILVSSAINTGASISVFGLFDIPLNVEGLIIGLIIIAASIFLTYLVVKLNEAQRIITVSYAKRVRGNRTYGGVDTVLPIKLITAGVIPIIFAVAFLAVPAFVGQVLTGLNNPSLQALGLDLTAWFGTGTGGHSGLTNTNQYVIAYFLLVVGFTYFYTGIVFNAKDIAENLQAQGGFIKGVRPGASTEKYLRRVVNRLTLFGSMALGVLAVMPFFVERIINTSQTQLTLGGTGLLIVVSVGIETLRQIESKALMVTYDAADAKG